MRNYTKDEKQDRKNKRSDKQILDLLQKSYNFLELADGTAVYQVRVSYSQGGVQLVVKGIKKGNRLVISFTNGVSLDAAVNTFVRNVKDGARLWRHDKWGKRPVAFFHNQ